MPPQKLKVVYILSSKYDDEGHVIRYWRGILPSNSLSVMKSLTDNLVQSGELGDLDVSVEIYDDTVQRIPVRRIARANGRRDTRVVVGLVGVQSGQFCRASDLALQFRDRGVPVMLGGFHVSGMLTMFDEPAPELRRLLDRGVSLVKGEAEAPGALAKILRDAAHDRLRPRYDITPPPDIAHAPIPKPDPAYLRRFKASRMATLDTSRGCPFGCSFCAIINVQGRKMRARAAKRILKTVERNFAEGIDFYFFTDDNFSRSPIRDELLDGLIALRERGMRIKFMMQVDARAHAIPGFVEKARRAGCYMAFVGMESVNPANIEAINKVQNDASEYPAMVQTWHAANVLVHVGYIIGLPFDTRESVRNDVDALMHDVKVDKASFFMLVPAPGSRDHQRMVEEGVPLDADLNNFDSLHQTFAHARMKPGEWPAAFKEAWQRFYDTEHITNVMLRLPRQRYWQMFWFFMWYRYATLNGTHPMFTGLVRLKDRKARRAIFPREGRLRYAWRRARELAGEAGTFARLFFEFQEIWLLTRKPDDPRWATLADLRARWTDAQERLRECDLRGRCDDAAGAVCDMLRSGAERYRQLSHGSRNLNKRMRRRLARKAQEIDAYLRSFEGQMPSWSRVVNAERYARDNLLAWYEEKAIRYVAQRRRFNAYRRELLYRLRTGKVLTLNVSVIPRLVVFEFLLGVRFMSWFLTSA